MKPELEPFVEQIADPEQPWVWVPIETPLEFWDDLADQSRKAGFHVIDLDRSRDVADQGALLEAFGLESRNLNELKDQLSGLPKEGKGCVVLFRDPEALSEGDPETFEDLLDIAEVVNDARVRGKMGPFTLVTLDAEEGE